MDESSPLPAGREPLFVPVSRGSPMAVPAPPRLNNEHDQIMSVHKASLFSWTGRKTHKWQNLHEEGLAFLRKLRQGCTNTVQYKHGHYFIWQTLLVTSCQHPYLIKLWHSINVSVRCDMPASWKKTFPAPSLNMMSKNLTITAVQWTKTCRPQLMANRNSHEYCSALSQNSLKGKVMQIVT